MTPMAPMTPMTGTTLDSPIGRLVLLADADGLHEIRLPNQPPVPFAPGDNPHLARAVEQLTEYFAGTRTTFDLELAPEGTPFQREVWDALLAIPYGETCSYKAVAERIGKPAAVRAVGAANGRNPLPIVVPCHRVIGASGSLVGYGGGLDAKRVLLELERRRSAAQPELWGPTD
jgi:methylated-DNA-[protein]-cysteine S-methyltransferase